MKIKAFITKSEEVSRMIEKALAEEFPSLEEQRERGYETHVNRCKLLNDTSVPAIYHNKGYWLACIVEHCEENEYSLTIA